MSAYSVLQTGLNAMQADCGKIGEYLQSINALKDELSTAYKEHIDTNLSELGLTTASLGKEVLDSIDSINECKSHIDRYEKSTQLIQNSCLQAIQQYQIPQAARENLYADEFLTNYVDNRKDLAEVGHSNALKLSTVATVEMSKVVNAMAQYVNDVADVLERGPA